MWNFKKLDRKKVGRQLESAVRVLSNVADVAVHIRKPSFLGVSLLAVKAFDSYKACSKINFASFFDDWDLVTYPFTDEVIKCVRKEGIVRIHGKMPATSIESNVSTKIETFEVKGVTYGIVGFKRNVEMLAVPSDKTLNNSDLLDLLWEHYGPSISFEIGDFRGSNESLDLSKEDWEDIYPSKIAESILRHLSAFDKLKCCRAALFHGIPGSGKTEIMRYVAHKKGGRTLYVRASQLKYPRHVKRVLFTLKPDIVIIDDMDQSPTENLIEVIDFIRSGCSLLMASVNDMSKLAPAVLRSGRFDDDFKIDKLEDEIIASILEGIEGELAEKLRDLPISYLSDFSRQRKIFGDELDINLLAKTLLNRANLVRDLSIQKD